MANPFPFVAGSVLTAAQLNGIGEAAVAYTPTWTNLTVGNGVNDFDYVRINKFVLVRGSFTFGSTSSVSGHIKLSMPFTSVSYTGNPFLGFANFVDAGTNAPFGGVLWETTSIVNLQAFNAAGTYLLRSDTSATIPFTWTNTDRIELQFVYEAA